MVATSYCAARVHARDATLHVYADTGVEDIPAAMTALRAEFPPSRVGMYIVVQMDVSLAHALELRDAVIETGEFTDLSFAMSPFSGE